MTAVKSDSAAVKAEKEKEGGGGGTGEGAGEKEATYMEGEKVLAYHGPLIYHAKVQKTELRSDGWKYFLHYSGWSKTWDEWVGPERLLKENVENLAMKARKAQEAAEKKRTRASGVGGGGGTPGSGTKGGGGGTPASSTKEKEKAKGTPVGVSKGEEETKPVSSGKGKKRKAESLPEPRVEEKETGEEKESGGEELVKIPLPASLKKQLVNDWRIITQDGQLVKLPRNPTVADVLQRYLEAKSKKDSSGTDNTAEVANGLRSYFDRALPAILLYKQERNQYSQALPEGTSLTPAEVYGAEHLLRLFIKLPELLSYIQMEEETLTLLVHKLSEFLKFLQKNQSQLFLQHYDGPRVETSKADSKDLKQENSHDTKKRTKEDVKGGTKDETEREAIVTTEERGQERQTEESNGEIQDAKKGKR